MAKEAFYFPHDCNASSDPKIMQLFTRCGAEGVGIYWMLIEILHQQEDGIISEDAYRAFLSFWLKGNTPKINDIEQMFNKTELILNKGGQVFSNRVKRNKELRQQISELRSNAGKRSGEIRALNSKNKEHRTSVQQTGTSVEQKRTNKIKEKEIKEREEPAPPFSFSDLESEIQALSKIPQFSPLFKNGHTVNSVAMEYSHLVKRLNYCDGAGRPVTKDTLGSWVYGLLSKEKK